jgi:hypothetical protein
MGRVWVQLSSPMQDSAFKQYNYVKAAKVLQYFGHKSEKVKKVLTKKEPNLNPSL